LHHLGAARRFVLIDRDSALVALARDNLARAEAPGECLTLDLERGSWPRELRQAADLVTANPPFFEPARARGSPHPGRNRARFGRLEPFLTAAALALDGARARAAFVYPARALAEFLATAHGEGLVPKRLRFVHARADSPARLALVELRLARPGGLEVEAPLVEWSAPSVRSPELNALLRAKTSDRK
jgi:tRNA1(Val) A37 N6-methylase TrmN6